MDAFSRFSIRNLLAITFAVCIALASLVKPSMWWCIMGSTLLGALLVRAIFFSKQWRVFGSCFAGALIGFSLSIYMVSGFQKFVSVFVFWERDVAGPLSDSMTGTGDGNSFNDFAACSLFWTAVTASGIAAYAVSTLFPKTDDRHAR